MGLIRRAATDVDTEFARRVHHVAYHDVVVRQFGNWDEAQQDAFFQSDWAAGGFDILAWEGEPCGYTAVDEDEGEVHVRELVVRPDRQGRGIGTTVLRAAIESAQRRGVPVVLGALHANRAAVLYERLGFQRSGGTATHTLFRLDPR